MQAQTIGVEMPDDFPTLYYNQIHLAFSKYSESRPSIWRECGSAWNGVAYRYLFCCDYGKFYTNSVKHYGNSPQFSERYEQEKNIFGFFVNGFSALECFCYALYAIAGLVDELNFPLNTDKDKRNVTFKSVSMKFNDCFSNEKISIFLNGMIEGNEFDEWSIVRNILSHRSTPSRHFRVGGDKSGQTDWGNIDLNDMTTTIRLEWLNKTLKVLLVDTNEFVKNNLST